MVLPVVNLRTEFELCSSRLARNIDGSHNLKCTLCLKKVLTIKLSVTLSNHNRFSTYGICYNYKR